MIEVKNIMKKEMILYKVAIIVGILVLVSVGYFIVCKRSITKNLQVITADTDSTLNNTEVKIENSTTVNTEITQGKSPTSLKTINSVDVRAMIMAKYNQTITDIKIHLSITYPGYHALAIKYPVNYSCGTSCESDFIKFQKEQGEVLQYIHSTFEPLVVSFCDLNYSIQKEEDRTYCHGYFDFIRNTNPVASTTLQRVMQDLKEWTHPQRATTS